MVWTALDLRGLAASRLATPATCRPLALSRSPCCSPDHVRAFTAGLNAGYMPSELAAMGDNFFPAGVPM